MTEGFRGLRVTSDPSVAKTEVSLLTFGFCYGRGSLSIARGPAPPPVSGARGMR